MKKLLQLSILLFGLTLSAQQVETELTNILNTVCDDINCAGIYIGSCPGDIDSEGNETQYGEFNVYYVTQDVFLNTSLLVLRNARLEFRNGANLIDNGIVIDLQTDCDDVNTTEIVFLGGGQQFGSVEEYDLYLETLSTNELEELKNNPRTKKFYYDLNGKKLKTLDYVSSGVYVIEYSLDNRVEREKTIKF